VAGSLTTVCLMSVKIKVVEIKYKLGFPVFGKEKKSNSIRQQNIDFTSE
jgi:hypothetical protein